MQKLKQRIAALFLILVAFPVMAQDKPNIGLVQWEVTMAEMLSDAGYATEWCRGQ